MKAGGGEQAEGWVTVPAVREAGDHAGVRKGGAAEGGVGES